MIFSINYSGIRAFPVLVLAAALLSGCASAPVASLERADAAPRLMIRSVLPDKASPQVAEMSTVRWRADVAGSTGACTFEFILSDGKEEMVVQEGSSPLWKWIPATPGTYRVRVVVWDTAGNIAKSDWSPEFKVGSMLEVLPVTPDKEHPQTAETTIRWKVEARGGVGKRTYLFLITDGTRERSTQDGESATWDWIPAEPGTYRVRVVVRDAAGTSVESARSRPFLIVPKLDVLSITPDKVSPQAAGSGTVRWTTEARGGVGERTFEFLLSDGKEEKVVQGGASGVWDWSLREPGSYRVKTIVQDAAGNRAESDWSPPYQVVPQLVVESLTPDKLSPQAVDAAMVRWKVTARGGVGKLQFLFKSTDGKGEKVEQEGPSPSWDWLPRVPGTYRIRAEVNDAAGNRAQTDWSSEYIVVPKLVVSLLPPEKPSPQGAGTGPLSWKVYASGGVGNPTFEFRLSDGKGGKVVQTGGSAVWDWSPLEPGTYLVRSIVRDSNGTTADTGWSPEYVIEPKLKLVELVPDKASPQVGGITTVRWKAYAAGGVGERVYRFSSLGEYGERVEQEGPSRIWEWTPREPGTYRVKVEVRDATGDTVESDWSKDYRIDLTATVRSSIAVMPVVNLTGKAIPVAAVTRSLVTAMRGKGLTVLEEDAQEKFLERYRVRYTGGFHGELGEALREETGVAAVLFVALETFEEEVFPKVALTARLVSASSKTPILWTDSVGISGNDAPGFLLLGLINDPRTLWHQAKEDLLSSLIEYLSAKEPRESQQVKNRFLPKSYHGIPLRATPGKKPLLVAVLPFRNESTRRNAGEIMGLHFLRELSNVGPFDVVEPGVVRQSLLRTRTIMEEGLSLPQGNLLRAELEVDLILTGIVREYKESIGGGTSPVVEFSTMAFDTKTRQTVWTSSSYNEGDDGVYFFNIGRMTNAHGMAAEMARSVAQKMIIEMQKQNGRHANAVSSMAQN